MTLNNAGDNAALQLPKSPKQLILPKFCALSPSPGFLHCVNKRYLRRDPPRTPMTADADNLDFEIVHGLLVNRIAPFVRKNWPYCQRSRFSQLGQHHRLTWPERLDVAAQDWKLSDSPARCARLVYSGASRPEKVA